VERAVSGGGSAGGERAQRAVSGGGSGGGERALIVTAPELAPPIGYAHAVIATGRTVFLGGQTALNADGAIEGETFAEQFDVAAGNVLAALKAAGAGPEDLVQVLVFVTDVAEYKASLRELGEIWKRRFGRRYPAMALLGVSALFDEAAKVELVATAVIA
jgi:enamine deaminase RidA (YjgF/YER057c/UK114 family)